MLYRVLAELVLLLHLAFIGFVVAGGLLVLRRRWLAWLHLPSLAWGTWIELAGGICPLTPLENMLRRWGGQSGYGGDFIEHYLLSLIYPVGLTRELQWSFAVALLVFNVIVYYGVWRRNKLNA